MAFDNEALLAGPTLVRGVSWEISGVRRDA